LSRGVFKRGTTGKTIEHATAQGKSSKKTTGGGQFKKARILSPKGEGREREKWSMKDIKKRVGSGVRAATCKLR